MPTRYTFSLADRSDEAALRRRMAADQMKGNIVLSFRREPDYFMGCAVQGDRSQIIKCSETGNGKIVGLGARHLTRLFVNGLDTKVGYLSDLRMDPQIRGKTLLARGYAYLRMLHEADPLPFYFSVILDGNTEALHTLTNARAGLPTYEDRGHILTPAIHLDRRRAERVCKGVTVRRGNAATMERVFAFLREQNVKRQFAPSYSIGDLGTARLQGLRPEDFYIAYRGEKIVGCVAAWDQSSFRQTHLEGYSASLRAVRPLYNLAARMSPLHALPKLGKQIRFLYLSLVATEHDDRDVFATLLRTVYLDRRGGAFHFLIAGLHEADPLCAVLDDYRRINASGKLFIIYYPEGAEAVGKIDNRTPYIEMASV